MIFLRIATLILIFCGCSLTRSEQLPLSDAEVDILLKSILSPNDNPSMQLQSVRRDIIRKLENYFEREALEDELNEYKRSVSSLARWNNLPLKRNVEALARAGYIKTLPDEEDSENESLKRSIAALARNGQLPVLQEGEEPQKRGIAELARNGELPNKREMQELIDELYDKRNIGSLARYSNFPAYGKRFLGSLARTNDLNRFNSDKRNVASLARDGGVRMNGKRNDDDENGDKIDEGGEAEKRNIASVKAQYKQKFKRNVPTVDEAKKDSTRPKREVDYYDAINEEYPQPVYQNQNIYDYEELIKALTGAYPETEKRFLGRLPQMGKAKTTPSPKTRYQ